MVLGIDTSTVVCSVALFDRQGVKSLWEDHSVNSHSRSITILIKSALAEAGIEGKDLEGIIFADGPGSYTGLRIGASAVKGLCYVLEIPMMAISHLRATAAESRLQYPEFDYHMACIDARRDNIYGYLQDKSGDIVQDVELVNIPETLVNRIKNLKGNLVLSGNGAEKVLDYFEETELKNAQIINSASHLRHFAFQMIDNQEFKDETFFEPFYLQSPRITQGKKLLL